MDRIKRLIKESSYYNIRLVDKLKNADLDFLVWSSPSSCRSPEEADIWHPFYEKIPVLIKICRYLFMLIAYFCAGVIRFFTYNGFYFKHVSKKSAILSIIPYEITNGGPLYQTDYLIENPEHPVDHLVFSRLKNIGSRHCGLSYRKRIYIFLKLFFAVVFDFFEMALKGKLSAEYIDNMAVLIKWIISQQWYFHWDFYHFLNDIIGRFPEYRIMLSLHEMHFYSKIIWRVSRERGLKSVTAQHAMIIPEKLWYFPQHVEVVNGCPLPDIFFVYSDNIKSVLQSYYINTDFRLCCSPRFSKWKTSINSTIENSSIKNKRRIIFAGAITYYDTNILVQAVKRLLKDPSRIKWQILLRLHPHGRSRLIDKLWIRTMAKFNKIIIDKDSLQTSLSKAALVIGCGSAVLREALLSRNAVLGIYSPDYIHPSILTDSDDWNKKVTDLSWNIIEEKMIKKIDPDAQYNAMVDMGLFSPDLTTSLLYSSFPKISI